MKRFVAVLCIISMLMLNAGAFDIPYGKKTANPKLELPVAQSAVMEGGSVIIEAEDAVLDRVASIVEDKDASDGEAVRFSPSASAMTSAEEVLNPTLRFDFLVQDSGVYNVWARIKAADAGSDSAYIAINNEAYSAKYFTAMADYQWANLSSVTLKKGAAYVSFKYREMNFIVDKLIVTADSAFVPKEKDDKPNITEAGTVSIYPEPPIKPIAEHPRVILTPDYIVKLKEYVKTDELKNAYATVKQLASQEIISVLPESASGNYNAGTMNQIQCRALVYALGEGNPAYAKETIRHAVNYLETVTFPNIQDITRQMGTVMTMGALVYDWCYDQMTEADKEFFIEKFKEIGAMKEIGYYPTKGSSIGSHSGEYEIHRDMLSAGIACYDEDPEMYNVAAGRLFAEFVESRKLFNQAGSHPNGSAYGEFRLGCETYADLIYTRMGYPSIYGEEIKDVPMKYIYDRLPDGYIMRDGDDYTYSSRTAPGYHLNYFTPYQILGNLYDQPYVRGEYMKQMSMSNYNKDAFWTVLCANPEKAFKSTDDLPLAYRATYPLTSITARTSWQSGMDAPTVVANMRAHERTLYDHMHDDAGHFQIYYKGSLALDSGTYAGTDGGWGCSHDFNYHKRSIAHNVVTVYDPNEQFIYSGKAFANDGGQKMRTTAVIPNYEGLMSDEALRAQTQSVYIGPNETTPEFSYLKSNLTPAYSGKISDYKRSMVFMDLFDQDYPAAFVVFDKVTSTNKEFKKKWLLHSVEEPEVNGTTTVISRTKEGYNGKLVNKTMLPSSFTIDKVGGAGYESYVDGVNYLSEDKAGISSEQGEWRIELSPKSAATNDVFLNAMYVTDYDRNLPELPMYQESAGGFVGVTVKDRMVMFAREAGFEDNSFTLKVRDNGFDTVSCMIGDVANGTWNISGADGSININVSSKEGENVLYFKAAPGSYTITRTENGADTFTYAPAGKQKVGDFMIYDGKLFRYAAKPSREVNGVAYVAAKPIFEQMGAEVGWDAENNCAYAQRNGETIFLREGAASYSYKGMEIPLDGEIFTENGVMYVPVLNFKDFLSHNMRYDSLGKILYITEVQISEDILKTVNMDDVIKPEAVTASGNDGNIEANLADYSLVTRWSCEGSDCSATYDLGQVHDISRVMLAFYSGDKRKTYFDIEVSSDGEAFTQVFSGESSGTTTGLETFGFDTVKARYVRFRGHGTSIAGNYWNSVTEMIILK